MFLVDGKLVEKDEPSFFLDEDSQCYGCEYYEGESEEFGECHPPELCVCGSMNGYRMNG